MLTFQGLICVSAVNVSTWNGRYVYEIIGYSTNQDQGVDTWPGQGDPFWAYKIRYLSQTEVYFEPGELLYIEGKIHAKAQLSTKQQNSGNLLIFHNLNADHIVRDLGRVEHPVDVLAHIDRVGDNRKATQWEQT